MPNRSKRTPNAREAFLTILKERCNVTEACAAAGIGRSKAYEWRDADPDFAAAWEMAEEEAVDRLEAEAWRRALDGVDEPVIYQGRPQYVTHPKTGETRLLTVKKYSDRMLEKLLTGRRRDKFGINQELLGGGVVFAGLVIVGPGGEVQGPANGKDGNGAIDITPPKRKNGGTDGE